MSAQLIDGKALAAQVQAEVAERGAALRARGVEPHLVVILVGDNPASQVYVRSKVQDSQKTGLKATLEAYPADMAQAQLLERIAALNADAGVHGILVQRPLPAHMDAERVLGVTYREDKPAVVKALKELTNKGLYKPGLY